jgi:hypothetical protein
LFVILGVSLGTTFIAGGCVVAAGAIGAAMTRAGGVRDAPITAAGVLVGIAAFVILRVVLSVPLWIDVVSGLGVMGLYSILESALRSRTEAEAQVGSQGGSAPVATPGAHNGHDRVREPVGAR